MVSSLQGTVLASKASTTTDKYLGGWKRWKSFAGQHKLQVFPVKRTDLALYIEHLSGSAVTISPIDTTIYSIRWAHNLSAIPSPTEDSFVKAVAEGCRRRLAKPKSPKEPISAQVLSKLVADKGGQDASISDFRLLFMCLVSFAGILRCEETISLRVRDISFFHDHMTVHVPKRKNDQYRQGHTVYIARTVNPTCPVSMTERYISMLGVSQMPSHPLACRLKPSKRDGLKPSPKTICYTTARELIVKGLAPSNIGTHSLRAGGASEAASASAINERCIMRQGGWKSASSKDMYIKDSIKECRGRAV